MSFNNDEFNRIHGLNSTRNSGNSNSNSRSNHSNRNSNSNNENNMSNSLNVIKNLCIFGMSSALLYSIEQNQIAIKKNFFTKKISEVAKITKVPVLDANGLQVNEEIVEIVLDTNGQPVVNRIQRLKLDQNGQPIVEPVERPRVDINGNVILDSDGQPEMETILTQVYETVNEPVYNRKIIPKYEYKKEFFHGWRIKLPFITSIALYPGTDLIIPVSAKNLTVQKKEKDNDSYVDSVGASQNFKLKANILDPATFYLKTRNIDIEKQIEIEFVTVLTNIFYKNNSESLISWDYDLSLPQNADIKKLFDKIKENYGILIKQISKETYNRPEKEVEELNELIEAQNEKTKAEHDAQVKIAHAYGEAEATKIMAQAEAEAMKIKVKTYDESTPEGKKHIDDITRFGGKRNVNINYGDNYQRSDSIIIPSDQNGRHR